jgi:hypothetical protein
MNWQYHAGFRNLGMKMWWWWWWRRRRRRRGG